MQEGGPDGQHSAGPDHQRIPLPRQTRVSELRPAICKAASGVRGGCLVPLATGRHQWPGGRAKKGGEGHFRAERCNLQYEEKLVELGLPSLQAGERRST